MFVPPALLFPMNFMHVERGGNRGMSGSVAWVPGFNCAGGLPMSLRLSQMAIASLTLLVLGATALILQLTDLKGFYDPGEMVWMERVRRNSLEQVAPFRDMIAFPEGRRVSIFISSSGDLQYAHVTVGDNEQNIILNVIQTAKQNIAEIGGNRDVHPGHSVRVPRTARKLFEIKDRLWEGTLKYLDIYDDIFSDRRPVSSVEFLFAESQVETFALLLETEFAKFGYKIED